MHSHGNSGSLHDLASFVYSVVLVAFAFIGMGGVVYHCLAPAGVFAPSLGRLWTGHPLVALLVSMGLVAMVLAARGQVTALRPTRGSNDIPLYVFVTLGTFFASRLLVNGTL
jgi:hypothetical protein